MSELDQIDAIRLSLASPEHIRNWSSGEVIKPATINYKTGKPEPGGLFCERIFGPERDWTCSCGTYHKASRHAGKVCEWCKVAVVRSSVRRRNMGHIELAVPIAHPWFARGTPNIMALLLGVSPRQLEHVLAYSASIVTFLDRKALRKILHDMELSPKGKQNALYAVLRTLEVGTVLEDPQLAELCMVLGEEALHAGRGAAAVGECLAALDLAALATVLRCEIKERGLSRKQAIKRLQVVEALRASGIDPSWMIFPVIPVLPAALRPLVELKNGHLAANDLNLLYERILCRNARIKQFVELDAPDIMLNNEKRLLQNACDALLDNTHVRTPLRNARHQPLKSLTAILSSKGGRFRRNLLGKRVDYSGRSVIVGDQELLLHQCGLPTKLCLELFKPFLIRKLVARHFASSPHAAKRMIERVRHRDPFIWDALEEVMHERLVLLNRAPTLHRLSIQAFEAIRVEGSAIRLHPLVCSAFNADFDGDQMAVHLPLSDKAQAEAAALLLSTRNLRSAASGEPTISLGQDISLGLSYLTQVRPSAKSTGRTFADTAEALLAKEAGVINLQTRIRVRLSARHIYETPDERRPAPANATRLANVLVDTTLGRLLLNEAVPEELRFRNYRLTKERIKQLVADCLTACGPQETAALADRLKTLGFHHATLAGISFAMSDIETLPDKSAMLQHAHARAQEIEALYREGMLTAEESERQTIEQWMQTQDTLSKRLEAGMNPYGTLATIITSGATKAKFGQIRQLAGMLGLMSGTNGRINPIPILGNYKEGLQSSETFRMAGAARFSLMTRPLSTATTGHLTRRLVEAGQSVWITEEDCGTDRSLAFAAGEATRQDGLADMWSRLSGRVLAETVGPVPAGTLLDETLARHLLASGTSVIRVRSPLTCQARTGICRACYGSDLATGKAVRRGLAVGVIAGQSIGEPGTQLSMRVFHQGGIAGAQGDIRAGLPRVIELFEGVTPSLLHRAVLCRREGQVSLEESEEGAIRKVHVSSASRRLDEYPLAPGTRVLVRRTDVIDQGYVLAVLPQDVPIHARTAGTVYSVGDGLLCLLVEERETDVYPIPSWSRLVVAPDQYVEAGQPLTDGSIDPREVVETLGYLAGARYLVEEVQRVFRATGVYIHDKHVEIIARQMLCTLQVTDAGDTGMTPGALLAWPAFEEYNTAILAQGGTPGRARPVLLGLTKTVLQTGSWVAAASFQETSNVLTWAAIAGRTDSLRDIKSRVIVGKPIPLLGDG